MAQTRMFRDRVVSMEQTLEGGEKNLEFLKGLCKEAFPEFDYRSHALDHERDLFVVTLEALDGRKKTVGWTRMVLFDAERLPALVENPVSPLRSRILAFLQARAARTEILVTFRHLEDGWVDTPEPRREKRRGRRGGRDGRGRSGQPGRREGREDASGSGRSQGQGQGQGQSQGPRPAAAGQPAGPGGGRPAQRRQEGGSPKGGRSGGRPERAGAQTPREPRPAAAAAPRPPGPASGGPGGAVPAEAGGEARPGGRRRRLR